MEEEEEDRIQFDGREGKGNSFHITFRSKLSNKFYLARLALDVASKYLPVDMEAAVKHRPKLLPVLSEPHLFHPRYVAHSIQE